MTGQEICKPFDMEEGVRKLREALDRSDAVVIGAGAGLSASAGFEYTGERFDRYFRDFARKYHFRDMYSGGFHAFETPEEHWAYWSRYIYINRYMDAPKPVYHKLFDLVKGKDYFVLTTNVDHCFQKAGFDKRRLFYTQGDYGLFQCSRPCHLKNYDNEAVVREMVKAQGFVAEAGKALALPAGRKPKMAVPPELVPYCPVCGGPMGMNLRADHTFVEDEGWHGASKRYTEFLRSRQKRKVLFLEAAVGYNTPAIIKYSFWHMAYQWKNAGYVCLNNGEAYAPEEIKGKAICINGDVGEILNWL